MVGKDRALISYITCQLLGASLFVLIFFRLREMRKQSN